MKRRITFLLLTIAGLLTGCRKDELRWGTAERLPSGTTLRLNQVLRTADGSLMIVGGSRFFESVILLSSDGGASWLRPALPNNDKGLYGCTQDASGKLYAIGFDAKFLFSADGGATWGFEQVGTWAPYKAMAPVAGGKVMAVGGVSYDAGLRTWLSDSGKVQLNEDVRYELNDIAMRGATGFQVGTGAVLKTADSGRTWSWQPVAEDNFKAVWMVDANTAFICGYNGSFWRTTDAGAHWTRLRNGNDITLPRYRLYDVRFTDAQHGWAVGEDGCVISTDDGGEHWSQYERFTESHLYGIEQCADGAMVVCGEGGEVWKLR